MLRCRDVCVCDAMMMCVRFAGLCDDDDDGIVMMMVCLCDVTRAPMCVGCVRAGRCRGCAYVREYVCGMRDVCVCVRCVCDDVCARAPMVRDSFL